MTRKLYANETFNFFSKCSVDEKCFSFKIHCSNFYCAHNAFDHTKAAMKKLKIAYNNLYVHTMA